MNVKQKAQRKGNGMATQSNAKETHGGEMPRNGIAARRPATHSNGLATIRVATQRKEKTAADGDDIDDGRRAEKYYPISAS